MDKTKRNKLIVMAFAIVVVIASILMLILGDKSDSADALIQTTTSIKETTKETGYITNEGQTTELETTVAELETTVKEEETTTEEVIEKGTIERPIMKFEVVEGEVTKENEALYKPVLDKYYKARQDMLAGTFEGFMEDIGICYLFNYDTNAKMMGYTFVDINKDGVCELLIGIIGNISKRGSKIYDLYTIDNGEFIKVLTSGERDRYYLSTNNMFTNEGSNGADDSCWSAYSMNKNSITYVEGFRYGDGCILYSTDEEEFNKRVGEDISVERGYEIEYKYVRAKIKFVSIDGYVK